MLEGGGMQAYEDQSEEEAIDAGVNAVDYVIACLDEVCHCGY